MATPSSDEIQVSPWQTARFFFIIVFISSLFVSILRFVALRRIQSFDETYYIYRDIAALHPLALFLYLSTLCASLLFITKFPVNSKPITQSLQSIRQSILLSSFIVLIFFIFAFILRLTKILRPIRLEWRNLEIDGSISSSSKLLYWCIGNHTAPAHVEISPHIFSYICDILIFNLLLAVIIHFAIHRNLATKP
jgi:hypothetical protein